jgi:2-(1,2-epoxy-1,2-dihydrophenyl)acetyl-CoA isomerase
VRFTVERGLAWITLDRPQAKNAIDDAMREALLAALERVGGDEGIRAG